MNGAGGPDLLARDTAGVLWLYPISGNAVFGARIRISADWNGYSILGPLLARPGFVRAAPTFTGTTRLRLPSATSTCYDRQTVMVSHLHSNNSASRRNHLI